MQDFFMVLSDKIVDLSNLTGISVDRMSLDITLSQAMSEENRADMTAFMETNETRSGIWVQGQVMHDIEGFKQEHLSDEPTGFVARTSGCADSDMQKIHRIADKCRVKKQERPQIILFMQGGMLQGACSTVPDIEVTVADKDEVVTGDDEDAYNILVDISSGDGYTAVY